MHGLAEQGWGLEARTGTHLDDPWEILGIIIPYDQPTLLHQRGKQIRVHLCALIGVEPVNERHVERLQVGSRKRTARHGGEVVDQLWRSSDSE